MRLVLKNFRCYTDRSFDFGENKLTLISGNSGAGKTTIMLAINFALFGTGTNLFTWGKTSCSVELYLEGTAKDEKGLSIVRTRRPNRLVVNDVHEDSEGQDIINSKFGDNFEAMSYVSQSAIKSFVMMSPIDKLSFLEKFAFGNANLAEIKGKCKALISSQNDLLVEATSKLEMASQWLNQTEQPVKVDFPVRCKAAQRELAEKNTKTKLINARKKIARCEDIDKSLTSELSSVRVLDATIKSKLEAKTDAKRELCEIQIEMSKISYEGCDALTDMQNRLTTVVNHRETIALKSNIEEDILRLNEMRINEENSFKHQLLDIESQLWVDYSKVECKELIENLELQIKDLDTISRHRKELDQLKFENIDKLKMNISETQKHLENIKDLKEKLIRQGVTYSCPSCESTLRLADGNLQLASDAVVLTGDLESLEKEVKLVSNKLRQQELDLSTEQNNKLRYIKLETDIKNILDKYEECSSKAEAVENLESIREYYSSCINFEKRKIQLEDSLSKGKFSESYLTMNKNLISKQTRLKNLKQNNLELLEDLTEDQLRLYVQLQTKARDSLEILQNRESKVEAVIQKYSTDINNSKNEHKQKYKVLREETELISLLEKVKCDLDILHSEVREQILILEKIEEWKRYDISIQHYTKLQKEVDICQQTETTCKNKYSAACTLKDTILEAESIAMSNIVKEIDSHAQIYLDEFFTDDPLTSRLEAFRTTKKSTKPQINITVAYKQLDGEPSPLSTGEMARLVMAYTLALSEMFNTPILLLDECTANMDQELTTTVFNTIKENFTGRSVLAIAHQCVDGIFDTVIKL